MNLTDDELSRVARTEHLMWEVVEMRKRHGAACAQHSGRAARLQLRLVQAALGEVAAASFKAKKLPEVDVDAEMHEAREFVAELDSFCQRVEDLKQRNVNTKKVLDQLKMQNPAFNTRKPLSASVLLARAKNKHN